MRAPSPRSYVRLTKNRSALTGAPSRHTAPRWLRQGAFVAMSFCPGAIGPAPPLRHPLTLQEKRGTELDPVEHPFRTRCDSAQDMMDCRRHLHGFGQPLICLPMWLAPPPTRQRSMCQLHEGRGRIFLGSGSLNRVCFQPTRQSTVRSHCRITGKHELMISFTTTLWQTSASPG